MKINNLIQLELLKYKRIRNLDPHNLENVIESLYN